jgi:polyisoprenoid-binding protein YceI
MAGILALLAPDRYSCAYNYFSGKESMPDSIADHAWALDPVHSEAGFSVRHMAVATFKGTFSSIEASLTETDGEISITGTVHPGDILVRDENLFGHLQSPDFFDAEKYPDITFASTSVRRDGEKLEVEGNLTMKGVTQPVTATGHMTDPTEDSMGNLKVGVGLETEVDRTIFGISWNAPLPKGGFAVSDEVTLSVQLEFVAQ